MEHVKHVTTWRIWVGLSLKEICRQIQHRQQIFLPIDMEFMIICKEKTPCKWVFFPFNDKYINIVKTNYVLILYIVSFLFYYKFLI